MTVSILSYSSVNTKTRALFGKLLAKHDYEELLAKKSVPDVAAYLKKNTSYAGILSDINENMVHRGELERLFKKSLYDDYVKLLHFLQGNPEKFLHAEFHRYELEDLKMLFRVIYTNRESQSVMDSLEFLKKYSSLDFNRLASSENIQHLIANLNGSEYFKVLSPLLNSSKQPTLFDIEISLDMHYFMSMLKLKDKLLSGADREIIAHILGVEIDILNIFMIYRCKKLFGFPAEQIYKYVIPYWHGLSREQLVQLTQSRDIDEFKALVSMTKYQGIFISNQEHLWETKHKDHMYKKYKRQLRSGGFSFGMTIAYLRLKEMDIANIITLIEGIRYNLDRAEVKNYLIGINM